MTLMMSQDNGLVETPSSRIEGQDPGQQNACRPPLMCSCHLYRTNLRADASLLLGDSRVYLMEEPPSSLFAHHLLLPL